MASLGLPPIMTAFSNLPLQREALAGWKEAAQARGMDVDACRYPMMVNCIIADTDEEAYNLAKRYIPRFQQAQIDHYEADDGHFETLSTYTAWAKIFAKMKARTDPANIPPWADGQFVGSPETVRQPRRRSTWRRASTASSSSRRRRACRAVYRQSVARPLRRRGGALLRGRRSPARRCQRLTLLSERPSMQLDPALAEILASLDPSAETPVEEMTPEDARTVWKEEMAAVAGQAVCR